LREYKFDDINHYNSLRLVRQKKYTIGVEVINIEIIQKILLEILPLQETNKIPFPQADSFERIINLCELLKQKITLTKEDITTSYDFDKRQTNYYTDAGRYLGLINKESNRDRVIFSLTPKAIKLFNQSIIDRQLEFIKLILSYSAFSETLKLYLEKGEPPTRPEIVEIMKKSNLYKVEEESTYNRRSSTILSWVHWILNQIED
jgi:hypothetical protein